MNPETAFNTEGTEKSKENTEGYDTFMAYPMGVRMFFSVSSVSLWSLC